MQGTTVYHGNMRFQVPGITQHNMFTCSLRFVCVTLIVGEIQEQREFMLICTSLSLKSTYPIALTLTPEAKVA